MTEEKMILGAGTDYPLNGMLTMPDDRSEKVPAVVFVHGSGSSSMDEKIYKITPFRDLAHGLAARGIASIRYDKRSYAHPMKMMRACRGKLTVREETIADAVMAAELLRGDARIDPDRIFIIGHSMGGMLAPRIDAEGGNFRGLIIMAGTPRRLEEVVLDQLAATGETVPSVFRGIFKKQAAKYETMFDGLSDLTDEEAMKKKFGGGVTLYYFKEMGRHQTPETLQACKKPMLIMQGEKDVQVSAERDFALYQRLLSDREDVQFRLYEGLSHAFVPAIYGTIDKAAKEFKVEQHIGDAVLDDIAAFIGQY